MSKENKVYRFVRQYLVDNNGRSPSYSEIMDACGIASKSNVKPILDNLVGLGMLKLTGIRGIQLPNSKLVIEEEV